MGRIPRLVLSVLAFATPLTASAIPITYQIEFTVLTGNVTTVTFGDTWNGEPPAWTSTNAVGKTYFGLFAVDSNVLLTDGLGKFGVLDYFFIQMEDNVWGYNLLSDNSFAGFRGQHADTSCASAACLGAPAPGFDVVNGEIVNLRGGVYGAGDVPFVDFSPRLGGGMQIPNMFSAIGNAPLQVGGTRSFVGSIGATDGITGTMKLVRVSEPSVLLLFGLALAGLGLTRRICV